MASHSKSSIQIHPTDQVFKNQVTQVFNQNQVVKVTRRERMMKWWFIVGKRIEEQGEDAFEFIGRRVWRNPLTTIGLVLGFIGLCAVGFLNLQMENEGDKLWIPQDSRAIKDERYVEDHFDAGLRGGSVLFVPTSAANRDLINLDVFDRIWDIHEDIVKKVKGDGKNFEDLCAIKDNDNECFVVGPVQFFSGDRDYYDSVVQNRDDLAAALSATTYPDGSEVNRNQIFGDYKVDSSNQITSIKAAVQYYNVEGNPLSRALEWELNYIDELSGESGSDELDVYYYANRSLDDELGASVTGDILLLVITYVLMFTITGIVLAKRYDSFVHFRTGLSIAGIVIVLLSMLAGYGVCAGLGVPFNSLHQVLPFIIIGIGVDDMFIIIAAFDAQDDDLDTAERMARGLRRCGLSILYTTMTDVVAFYLGAASALPAITAFCLYAATTLLFNFCFQITIFAALACLDSDRIKAGRYDIIYCLKAPESESNKSDTQIAPSKSETAATVDPSLGSPSSYAAVDVEAGADDVAAPVEGEAEISECHDKKPDEKHNAEGKAEGQEEGEEERELSAKEPAEEAHPQSAAPGDVKPLTPVQRFIADRYVPFITNTYVRIAVVVSFAAVLGVMVYGCTRLEQGFDVIDLVPDDSYVREYITAARKYDLFAFEENLPVDIVYKDIPYHTQDTQEEMLDLQRGFLKQDHVTGPLTSWLSDFLDWSRSDSSPYFDDLNGDGFITNKQTFYNAVEDFLALPEYERFERDIRMKGGEIRASRVSAYHIDMQHPADQIAAMHDAREYASRADISPQPRAYSDGYKNIETEKIIGSELTMNLGLALLAVGVVSLFILIRPMAVLLVLVLVSMVDVDILGSMFFWDLKVNTVTVIQLVMAVGLVVDYIAHVLHYYLQQPFALPPNERLKNALIEIGPSVLLGCTTTFIGILPLAWASSVIFRTFFRMFFLIIVYGASHGLILLPAILPCIPFGDISHYSKHTQELPIAVPAAESKELEMKALTVVAESDAEAVVPQRDDVQSVGEGADEEVQKHEH